MNKHPYSGCHYKRNSSSTPAGMNNLHTRGPTGQQTPGGCHHLSTDDSGHLHASATMTNGGRPSLHRQIPTQVLPDRPAPTSARRRRAGVRTRQSKSTNAALAAYDVLDDPPVQSATREGPQTCPTCARRDSRPCGGRIAMPGPNGRRQHRRRRQSQLSQRARHAAADDARGRPGPRCRSSPPPRGR
jgi:hypothetical protein